MPAAVSSPIPAVLLKLGPLDADRVADVRPYLDAVPDPRSRRGRWYALTAVLLICAAAVVAGAKSLDELAEWGERASHTLLAAIGIRRHLLRWRRTPSAAAAIGRVLRAVDGDASDAAVGAYLAERHRVATDGPGRQIIAVDGKALKGSAHLNAPRRHLLSAVTHGRVATLAQVEVGAKTNETRHFKPLLAPLDPTGTAVTFDAPHSVKANVTWLVETKKAHCIAVIKTNQPTAYAQLNGLNWSAVAVQHTASTTGHGRRESRSIKILAIADNLGGIAFPHAKLALRVHRRRQENGKKQTRETVSAVTSLDAHQAGPAELATAIRGHWSIEAQHHIRDRTFAEDAPTIHTGTAPRAMATLRNLAIGTLKILGVDNIAKTTRAIRHHPGQALRILGITSEPNTPGT